ncbi:MAG: hypothetical protein JXQ26_08835, partial [Tissierellales bacterium]|nr:hypothetical protein [Tissierellales bacterium]
RLFYGSIFSVPPAPISTQRKFDLILIDLSFFRFCQKNVNIDELTFCCQINGDMGIPGEKLGIGRKRWIVWCCYKV